MVTLRRFSLLSIVTAIFLLIVANQTAITFAAECDVPAPEGWSTVTVQPGDTLYDISLASGATVGELADVNCLPDNVVVVGTTLAVPLAPDSTDNIVERCRLAGLTIEECREIFDDGMTLAERCRNAGLTPEECREIINDSDSIPHIVLRCRNAGYTLQECRRIINGSDDHSLAERCRNAGFTVQECRRIINGNNDDDGNIWERCRRAGLTAEQCRRIVNAADNENDDLYPNLAERCRLAGLTLEECRRLVNTADDDRPTVSEICREAGYITPEECRRYINSLDDKDDDKNTRTRETNDSDNVDDSTKRGR